MQIDTKIFELIENKLGHVIHNKTCDENYIQNLCGWRFEKLDSFIKDLCLLNSLSYSARYKEESFTDYCVFLDFYKYSNISCYQLLKYLHCICYNIEIDTIKESKFSSNLTDKMLDSYKILHESIDNLTSSIINNLPEYKSAKYAEAI